MSSSPLSGTDLEALFYYFPIGSVVNPVNSCIISEHGFLQWGVIVSGLMVFTVFFFKQCVWKSPWKFSSSLSAQFLIIFD